jgi:hypothetical protein
MIYEFLFIEIFFVYLVKERKTDNLPSDIFDYSIC